MDLLNHLYDDSKSSKGAFLCLNTCIYNMMNRCTSKMTLERDSVNLVNRYLLLF